jgi:uncharacterized OsmC-like protein
MDRETLKALQAPLKELYLADPQTAMATLHASGTVDFQVLGCRVALPCNDGRDVTAGLHKKAGGDGNLACAGDLLLSALVTCAGTTMAAVATAMGVSVASARIEAIGIMDFRGTLAVDRSIPVGLSNIELQFFVETSADDEQIQKLIQLTERYCVVLQTLLTGVHVSSRRIEPLT